MKISTIVTTYNSAEFLPRLIDSFLQQEIEDSELIIVDQGSTDDTLRIVEEYLGGTGQVRLFQIPEFHRAKAKNLALQEAYGDFIHFAEATDEIMSYGYRVITNKAEKYNLDMLRFCSINLDPERDETVDLPEFTLSQYPMGDFQRLLELEPNSPRLDRIPDERVCLFRKSFLTRYAIRFAETEIASERLFLAKAVLYADRFMICRDRVLLDRINLNPISTEDMITATLGAQESLAKLLEDPKAIDLRKKFLGDEFDGFCSFLGHTIPEDELDKQLRVVEAYISQTDPKMYISYRRSLKKTKDMIELGERENIADKVDVFYEMPAKPKVSVVVPIYNQEDYLNETLHALSKQNLKEMEFILVNDGSTDGSMDIMREYSVVDQRFKIIDKENSGYGQSMNMGMAAATGEYIGIFEPDDHIPETMYSELYTIAKRNDVDWVKSDFYLFIQGPDGSVEKRRRRLSEDRSYYGRLINPVEEQEVFQFFTNTWTGIYKRSFLEENGIRHNETPGASYQDNGFWFQTFACATRGWFVNQPYYMYRRDNPNASIKDTGKKLYCITEEYQFIEDWLRARPELAEKLYPMFYKKKYDNFITVYRRIDVSRKREYLHHLQEQFASVRAQGIFTEELLGTLQWKNFNEIMDDPDAYFEKIRISAILPLRGRGSHLDACLNSLLAREEVRNEVICVDLGLSDEGKKILQEFSNLQERLQIIECDDDLAKGLNRALDMARGEYVFFGLGNDTYSEDFLRLIYAEAWEHDADISIVRNKEQNPRKVLDAGVSWAMEKDLIPRYKPFRAEDIVEDFFRCFGPWIWDKAFRRSFLLNNGLRFPENSAAPEALFGYRALLVASGISVRTTRLIMHRDEHEMYLVPGRHTPEELYKVFLELRETLEQMGVYRRFEWDYVNFVWRGLVLTLEALPWEEYSQMAMKLKELWLDDLNITSHDEHSFYSLDLFQRLLLLLNSDPKNYVMERLRQDIKKDRFMRHQISRLVDENRNFEKQKIRSRKREMRETRKTIRAELRLEETKNKLERVSDENRRMRRLPVARLVAKITRK